MRGLWLGALVLGGGYVAYKMVRIPGLSGSGGGLFGMPAVNSPGGLLFSSGVQQPQTDYSGQALVALAKNSPDLVRAVGEGIGGLFGGGGDSDDSDYWGDDSEFYQPTAQQAGYQQDYGGYDPEYAAMLTGQGQQVAYNEWPDGGGGSDYDPYWDPWPEQTYA